MIRHSVTRRGIASWVVIAACGLAVADAHGITFNFTIGSNLAALSGTNSTLYNQVLTGFNDAGNWWSTLLSNDVTMNVTIDFPSLGTGILGSASSVSNGYAYTSVRTALGNTATSANDATAYGSLPEGSSLIFQTNAGDGTVLLDNNASTNNNFLSVTRANAKALGILTGSPTSNDVTISFSSNFSWDFDRSNGITGGQYDFVGVAAHEIGHAMGFRSGVDAIDLRFGDGPNATGLPTIPLQTSAVFTVLDLYRNSTGAPDGVYDWTVGGTPGFTIDGGETYLGGFSTGRYNGDGQQASHFKDNLNLGIMDPTLAPGTLAAIKALDLTAMDVIGWTLQGMSQQITAATTLTATPYVVTGDGSLNIDGAAAALNLRVQATTLGIVDLTVGDFTQGSVTVSSAGTLSNSGTAVLAKNAGATASLLVSGANSSWDAGTLQVGAGGNATVTTQTGGLLTAAAAVLGLNSGATGTITLNGTNARLTISNSLILGQSGTGKLNVTNSGRLATATAILGAGATGVGTATISGNNARWTVTNGLYIGGDAAAAQGQGTLTVASGGRLDVLGLTKIWQTGTLVVGNGGTFNTDTLEVVAGSTFSVLAGGSFAMNHLNVNGGGTYVGNVQTNGDIVLNGTLQGNVTVNVGHTVGGSGVITGAISGAGLVSPGNSPGVMDAVQIDPTLGTDYLFEFTAANTIPDYLNRTASLNDVVHLTHSTTPFLSALTSNNVITVDFQVDPQSLTSGMYFLGGFFTNQQFVDFYDNGMVSQAMYNYLLNGSALNLTHWQVDVTTTEQPNIDFGSEYGGVVYGRVMQFTLTAIPEPGSLVLAAATAAGAYLRRRKKAAGA